MQMRLLWKHVQGMHRAIHLRVTFYRTNQARAGGTLPESLEPKRCTHWPRRHDTSITKPTRIFIYSVCEAACLLPAEGELTL